MSLSGASISRQSASSGISPGLDEREAVHLYVQRLDAAGKACGQLLLAVAAEGVNDRQIVGYDIVYGAGQLALARKGHDIVVAAVIAVGIEAVISHVGVALRALHHKAVVVDGAGYVLLHERRIDVGVALFHGDVTAQRRIAVEQRAKRLVLLAGLNHPVDGHVLLQRGQHALCLLAYRKDLRAGGVVLRPARRQGVHQHVERHRNSQDNHAGQDAVSADSQRLLARQPAPQLAEHGLHAPALVVHHAHLRFSMLCTVRKQNTPATVA